jgi:NAD(P)-dependent dehydrogenase (short-subunit alcohol dehydrogenase family)
MGKEVLPRLAGFKEADNGISMESRAAVITGGASGIGYAFAQAMCRDGYRVVIADLRGAEEAAARLCQQGASAIGVAVDVTDEIQVLEMASTTLSAFGRIDVLVNNAGLFATLALKPFEQITRDEWMRVMEVNTLGPFMCAKAVTPHMRNAGSGRIINIASTVPIKAPPHMAHYVASKGALIAFTRSLARELGATGVTVNAIAPGFTLSDGVLAADLQDRIGSNARTAGRCIQRDQVPGDLVGVLRFLAGDGSSFITGQTIAVDGGGIFL